MKKPNEIEWQTLNGLKICAVVSIDPDKEFKFVDILQCTEGGYCLFFAMSAEGEYQKSIGGLDWEQVCKHLNW